MAPKPVKRIAVVDYGHKPEMFGFIRPYIADRYDIVLTTDRNADYVFHSSRGYEVLQYSGVRIFITGENVSPDFNVCDYALGFDKMSFGDRYCWLPIIKLYPDAYAQLLVPRKPAHEALAGKEGFCAYVMSNLRDSARERTQVFDLLSAYKTVHSGGRWRNNVGGPVADKVAFQSKYKFVIAFENCSTPGYLTEKFAQAAAADAVPIYWGDPTVGKLFNPKAFINCHDFQTLEEAVEHVKHIDRNDDLYRHMLAEPWFTERVEPECLREKTFVDFLSHVFDQDLQAAYRRNRGRWGLKTERRLYEMYFRPDLRGIKLMRKKWREFWRKTIFRRDQ
ncbi:MAG: glycosyltransferase family 10 [Planctomycetota bacterium]